MSKGLPLFERWMSVLDWTLSRADGFPKTARFTLANRLSALSIDVIEAIIEAIYTSERKEILKRLNLYIEKLRVLFRLSFQRKYINKRQYEFISEELNECGRMVGGWIRHEANQQSV